MCFHRGKWFIKFLGYNRKNYKRWDTKIKPDLYEIVENYRTDNKLSRSEFLQKAIESLSKNNKK